MREPIILRIPTKIFEREDSLLGKVNSLDIATITKKKKKKKKRFLYYKKSSGQKFF